MSARTPGGTAGRACAGALVLALIALAAPAAAVVPARVPLEAYGHSYARGDGASAPSRAWGPQLAALLGSPAYAPFGVGQSLVSDPASRPPGGPPGGQSWWWAYRNVIRPGSVPAPARAAQPAIFTGLNDLIYSDVSTTTDALRAFATRVSEDSVVEDSNPSVRYGTGWSEVAETDRNSGAGAAAASGAPGPITITTPAGFRGGTVVLHGLVNAGGGRWAGTVALNGAPVASFDRVSDASGRPRPVVIAIRAVAPGANTITVDTTALAGAGAQFDYWGTISAASPYVIVFRQPRLTAAGYALHFWSTEARVAALDAGIDQVARELDNVIAVDLPAMNANPAYYALDNVHPNDRGHAYIAAQADRALRAAPVRSDPPRERAGISALRLRPAAFKAARRGAAILARLRTARGSSRANARTGTLLSFRLSRAGRVGFRAERRASGRRRGRRCVARTRRNASRRRCVRYIRVRGGFAYSGPAGSVGMRFSGRLGGRRLTPGRYRLAAALAGAARPARRAFRIVR